MTLVCLASVRLPKFLDHPTVISQASVTLSFTKFLRRSLFIVFRTSFRSVFSNMGIGFTYHLFHALNIKSCPMVPPVSHYS